MPGSHSDEQKQEQVQETQSNKGGCMQKILDIFVIDHLHKVGKGKTWFRNYIGERAKGAPPRSPW